jgi:hypothetical protein
MPASNQSQPIKEDERPYSSSVSPSRQRSTSQAQTGGPYRLVKTTAAPRPRAGLRQHRRRHRVGHVRHLPHVAHLAMRGERLGERTRISVA